MTAEELKVWCADAAAEAAVEMSARFPDASHDFHLGYYEGMVACAKVMAEAFARYVKQQQHAH